MGTKKGGVFKTKQKICIFLTFLLDPVPHSCYNLRKNVPRGALCPEKGIRHDGKRQEHRLVP